MDVGFTQKPQASRVDPDGSWQHDLFQTSKLDYGGDGDEDSSSKAEDEHSRRAKNHRNPRADNEPRSTRLKITNLHYEVSERELEVSDAHTSNLNRLPDVTSLQQ
jgi:hypothetical protein